MARKVTSREKRKARIRRKISGTAARPRLTIYRSLKHMYAQLVDDVAGTTLVSIGSTAKGLKEEVSEDDKTAAAKKVGRGAGQGRPGEGDHRRGLRPQRLRLPRPRRGDCRRRARGWAALLGARQQRIRNHGYSHQRERSGSLRPRRPHQPRRQGGQGRPALQLLRARRRGRRAGARRRRPRQGQRGPRGHPQGRRPGQEEPLQGAARRHHHPARGARPLRRRAGCCSSRPARAPASSPAAPSAPSSRRPASATCSPSARAHATRTTSSRRRWPA